MRLVLIYKSAWLVCAFCFVALAASPKARAQNLVSFQFAPPPINIVSSNERAQLSREMDAKKRLRLNVSLAEGRLHQAEQYAAQKEYQNATDELAAYQSILEDAFDFMRARTKIDNKTRDLYKYLELSMRAHAPRLEAIRRTTPSEYALYVKTVFDYTRAARTEALNSFYGETVIKEAKPDRTNNSTTDKPEE